MVTVISMVCPRSANGSANSDCRFNGLLKLMRPVSVITVSTIYQMRKTHGPVIIRTTVLAIAVQTINGCEVPCYKTVALKKGDQFRSGKIKSL